MEQDINYNKIVVLDTETIGFRPPYIISIALIVFQDKKRIDSKYLICNPDYPISPSASEINGFKNEDLLDKPLFPEIWEEIKDYLKDSIWVAHNAKFDESAIIQTCNRYGLIVPEHWVCCTVENAKNLIPKSTVQNYKLNTLCDYFNIELKNHHTASFDTLACFKIFNELIKLSNGNLKVKKG